MKRSVKLSRVRNAVLLLFIASPPVLAAPRVPASVARPAEPDEGFASPSVAALLPSSQDFGALNLRVVNAGFAAPNEFFPAYNSFNTNGSGFFFAVRLRARHGWKWSQLAQFRGFTAPDGETFSAGQVQQASEDEPIPALYVFAPRVNPKWKSVRAHFEVLDPRAPHNADGTYSQLKLLQSVPIPPNGTQAQPPARPIEFTSAGGARYSLQSVSRNEQRLTFEWKIAFPSGISKMTARFKGFTATTRGSISNHYGTADSYGNETLTANDYNTKLALDAREVDLNFELNEEIPDRKQLQFFRTLNFDIPVAPLLALAPPAPREAPFAPVKGSGPEIRLAIETLGRGWSGISGVLWVRDMGGDAAQEPRRWQVRKIEIVKPDGTSVAQDQYRDPNRVYFHSDNTLARADEVGTTFELRVPAELKTALVVPLRISVERARTLDGKHRFDKIPLPQPGQSLDFGPAQFADDLVALRRVVWALDAKPYREQPIRTGNGPALTFVFERRKTLGATAEFDANELTLFDAKNNKQSEGYETDFSDPFAPDGTDRSHFAFTLRPPEWSGPCSLSFATTERAWNGQPQTIALPDVPVPPNSD